VKTSVDAYRSCDRAVPGVIEIEVADLRKELSDSPFRPGRMDFGAASSKRTNATHD